MTEGKQIYSTYRITYETEDGHKAIYVDVGDLSQWMSRQAQVGMFAPHSGVLLLDEGYAGLDSRRSSSMANQLLTHFIFQCLEAHTIIETSTGTRQIRELIVGDRVLSTFGYQEVAAVHSKTVYGLCKVKLENGMEVLCTPEHRFLTRKSVAFDGQSHDIEAANLKVGKSWLYVNKPLEYWTVINDFQVLLGVVAAEGSFNKQNYCLQITVDDREQDLIDFIVKTVSKYYPDVTLNCRNKKRGGEILHGYTIEFGKKQIVESIHRELTKLLQSEPNHDTAASFLQGFVEGDGTVNPSQIQFTQADSKKVYRDYALSCLRVLGIECSSSTIRGGTPYQAEIMTLPNKEALRRFDLLVGFISRVKKDKLTAALFRAKHKYKNFLVPSRVVSIERVVGEFQVYDIEMKYPQHPYFFANGILAHNSRKLGLDLFVGAQLASSLDKRVRGLCDAWILAELQPRETLDKNGNVTLSVDDFRYTYAGVDGSFGEFVLAHEDAEKIFPYYSTMEVIQPPMIALDKKAALEAKKAIQQIGLAARKAQPSQIRNPLPLEQTELADAPHAKPKIRRKIV